MRLCCTHTRTRRTILVQVSFDTWSLRADSQHDYVEIHNGDSSKAPKLGPLRGSGAIEPLHSMGSSLWIEFHSGPAMAQPPPGKGFKITFSTTARGMVCDKSFLYLNKSK